MENKKSFEITFRFLHTRGIGYFEMADLDELCKFETRTKIVRAENPQKAENIVKHSFGKTTNIQNTREIKQERERTL